MSVNSLLMHPLFSTSWTFTPLWKINIASHQLIGHTQGTCTGIYYMARSVTRQDESNPALWLATRVDKMELSCPLGTTRCVLEEKFSRKPYDKSFIDQAYLVKMAGYWPHPFFASLWTLTPSRSINLQKKNLANIQPSWPHTWSITHMYVYNLWLKLKYVGYQHLPTCSRPCVK